MDDERCFVAPLRSSLVERDPRVRQVDRVECVTELVARERDVYLVTQFGELGQRGPEVDEPTGMIQREKEPLGAHELSVTSGYEDGPATSDDDSRASSLRSVLGAALS
jgi:hypothetical protein